MSGSPVKQKRSGSAGRRPNPLKIKPERRRPQSSPAMLRSFDGQRPMRHAHEDDFLQQMETGEVKRTMVAFKREKHVCKDQFVGVDLMADSYFYDLQVLHNRSQRAKATVARRLETISRSDSTASSKADRSACEHSKQSLEATAAERIGELCGTMKGDVRRAFDRWITEPNGMSPELERWMVNQGLAVEDADVKKKRERQELMASFGNMFKTVHNGSEADHKAAGIPSLGSTQAQDVEVARLFVRRQGSSKEPEANKQNDEDVDGLVARSVDGTSGREALPTRLKIVN